MALTFALKRTRWAAKSEDARTKEWDIVQVLIHLMLAIGIGRITEKNVAEVLIRIRFMEALYGAFFSKPDGSDLFVAPEMLEDLINLEVNILNETWEGFTRRHLHNWRREQQRMAHVRFSQLAAQRLPQP